MVVTTVSLAIVLSPKQEPLRTHPNIVVVIADDLGYNDVGYQGQGDIKTPYIDMLARYLVVQSLIYLGKNPVHSVVSQYQYPLYPVCLFFLISLSKFY